MPWTIDKDHLHENDPEFFESAVGRRNCAEPVTKDTPGAKRFRLYDDDGELYYEGWLTKDVDWELALNWAAYDSGCTSIRDGHGQHVIS